MVSEADNIYQKGWNDCLEWVTKDLENRSCERSKKWKELKLEIGQI